MKESSRRQLYLSVLNVVACFSVVVLHVNEVFWSHPSGSAWISANFLETFFYWAVPVFFMISGITLLDYRKRYSTREYFRKRTERTLIPFLFWSLFALCFQVVEHTREPDWNLIHIFNNVLNTQYIRTYWFFIPLFAVYLSFPVLSAVDNKDEVYHYGCILGCIFLCIIPLACSLLKIQYNNALTPPVVGGYVLYPLVGYRLNKVVLTKKQRYLIYFAGIIGWAMHFLGTHILSEGQQAIDMTFKGYLNLPCFMHSVAVFVLFKNLNYEKIQSIIPAFQNGILKLSELTFGVYLIHYYFLILLPQWFHINTYSMVYRTVGAVGVFLLCAGITWIMKKIPILRRLV